jgi:hypothetical protein
LTEREAAVKLGFLIFMEKRGKFCNGRGQLQHLTFRRKEVFISNTDI